MSRQISKAEGFETVYTAFRNVNFTAFDYDSIKQSMIEYIRLYFPEAMNDMIESSEFIALLEVFAYLGSLMAYRMDINAHENTIGFAQRKASILRLAKLISYRASRNVPARGLVKLTSVSTTERVFDSLGKDISNTVIHWNDPNNPNWKDQFFIVLGRILQQEFGTVSPNERVQVNDVIFELYPLKNNPLTRGVIQYRSSVSGQNYPMELVSSVLDENGPKEARPANNAAFNVLYGNDGFGDNSSLTGFFIYTKQGTLNKQTVQFDGIIPNQTFEIGASNVNNIDLWVNNIDPDTGLIKDDGSDPDRISGEWEEVDLANAQNIIFNTNPNRAKYEVETLENDDVRIIFGDGEFSNIPSGTFDLWYRTSSPEEIYIPQTAVVDKRASLTYTDANGRVQTVSFTFSLVSSLQNNSASEDIEHIRRTAPAIFYAQDRMVNARDYNTYPLQDSSILKLRTINRTFAGDTKYQSSNDPSFSYQNVRIFGEDLAVFYPNSSASISAPGTTTSGVLIENYIEPLLSTLDVFLKHEIEYITTYRREFYDGSQDPSNVGHSVNERLQIANVFDDVNYPWPVSLVYFDRAWSSAASPDGIAYPADVWVAFPGTIELKNRVTDEDILPNIVIQLSADQTTYTITYNGRRMVGESPTTYFFYDNSAQRVLSFESLKGNFDELVILQANMSSNPTKLLQSSISLKLIEVDRYTDGATSIGLPNLNRVILSTYDKTGDSVPDDILLAELMDTSMLQVPIVAGQRITLPVSYITGNGDVEMPQNITFVEDGIEAVFNLNGEYFVVNGNIANRVSSGNRIWIYPKNNPSDVQSFNVQSIDLNGNAATHIRVSETINGLNHNEEVYITIEGAASDYVVILDNGNSTTADIRVREYVYFARDSVDVHFSMVPANRENMVLWSRDATETYYKRVRGKNSLNFLWKHTSSQMNLVDPSTTNIHDMFVITRPYYNQFSRWLSGELSTAPVTPTPRELRGSYNKLLENKMLSDTVVLHPGKFKVLFGSKANPELRAKIKVIRSENKTLTDNQIKIRIVNVVREFFDIGDWEFGETFHYDQLAATIQSKLSSEISSTVLVPTAANHVFGDLYQVFAREDEILQVHITVDDVEVVSSYNSTNLKQIG